MASQKERVQRTGYELVVVWVDESAVLGADEGRISRKEEAFREAEKRYGGSGVDFMIKKIEDIYSVKSAVSEVLGESGVAEPAEANGFAEDDNRGRLQRLILSLLALTSRADILYQLRSRLLIHLAETLSCTAILYSQSTTALAQLVLSETVKGRGYSMPWQISDGMMPYLAKTSTGSNGVRIFFPLRDILRKELLRFVELTEGLPEIEVDVKGPTVGPAVAVNAKTTTIDDLMRGYFENMEDAYPSIVANVVKTASRLVPPSVEEGGGGWCKVCGLPKDVAVDLDMVYAEAEGPKGGGQREMCSGCARNMEGARGQVWPL